MRCPSDEGTPISTAEHIVISGAIVGYEYYSSNEESALLVIRIDKDLVDSDNTLGTIALTNKVTYLEYNTALADRIEE